MNVVWKFTLARNLVQEIPMPKGAVILSVQLQADAIRLWALVDPDFTTTTMRKFAVIGTGVTFDFDELFIGTVQTGAFVWHVFEIK